METWHMWIVAAIALFIAEIFTPGFLLACLGVACLASALVAFLDFGLKPQILTLSIATLVVFFGIRPFFLKHVYSRTKLRTNVDAIVGKIGLVSEKIDPATGRGRVKIGGEDWRGISANETSIEVGTRILVLGVDGIKLIVKPIQEEKEV